jgi:hypothetical protein
MGEEQLPSPVEAAKVPTKRLGRRALVLGLAAAGGAGALANVAGAKSAYAANGNPVLLGEANSATATTSISTTTGTGIEGTTSVNGQSGVQGWTQAAKAATECKATPLTISASTVRPRRTVATRSTGLT